MSLTWNGGWMSLGDTLQVYPDATADADAYALWLCGQATATLRAPVAQLLRDGLADRARLLLVCDELAYISETVLREIVFAQVQLADPANRQIVIVNARPEVLETCRAGGIDQQLPMERLALQPPAPAPVPVTKPAPAPAPVTKPEPPPQAITMLLISHDGAWFGLTDQPSASVGRQESADIVIPDEHKGVSRNHLKLYKAEDGYRLLDVGSANGTALDGEVVAPDTETPLRGAHLLTLGSRFGCLLLLEPLLCAMPEAYAAFWQERHLLAALRSRDAGTLYLTDAPLPLGRAHAVGDLMQSKGIGREHAQITCADGRYFVTDGGSRNGTFLNGERIAPHTPVPLAPHDQLRLGGEQYGETFTWEQRRLDGNGWLEG